MRSSVSGQPWLKCSLSLCAPAPGVHHESRVLNDYQYPTRQPFSFCSKDIIVCQAYPSWTLQAALPRAKISVESVVADRRGTDRSVVCAGHDSLDHPARYHRDPQRPVGRARHWQRLRSTPRRSGCGLGYDVRAMHGAVRPPKASPLLEVNSWNPANG